MSELKTLVLCITLCFVPIAFGMYMSDTMLQQPTLMS
jgi:hypothetical protein